MVGLAKYFQQETERATASDPLQTLYLIHGELTERHITVHAAKRTPIIGTPLINLKYDTIGFSGWSIEWVIHKDLR